MNLAHPVHHAPPVIAISPQHRLAPQVAIAASRAGALGLLDLGLRTDSGAMLAAVAELVRSAGATANWGLRCDLFEAAADTLEHLPALIGLQEPVPVLLLAGVGTGTGALARDVGLARTLARLIYLEVRDLSGARAAQEAGADGVILKGHEAGGQVSDRSSFMLAQECSGALDIPYWIQGGIGIHSAAAVMLSGAAGVVLGEQLWLAAEAPPAPGAASWDGLDGTETALVGSDGESYRCFARSGRSRLRAIERAVAQGTDWRALLLEGLLASEDGLLAVGSDIALAGPLARRYGTVGRIVTAIGAAIGDRLVQAAAQQVLAPDAALAQAHGTRFPVVQGPMTRVSDVAPFARAVAEAGALPFVALAVLRGPEVSTLLSATRALMGDLPWGVGILGFMPRELRDEQMAVLREVRPPFAVIAGGRPGQARELDELGIVTYLHVPSPGLLRSFLDAGARRLVFEGSECGGHTGPRTSFVLWQQAIDILLEAGLKDPGAVQVLFAGGIHDAASAAMVALMAAPLAALGMKVGVLMGTAYLFTDEIVASGAIVEEFQRQAIACEDTALLQSGVGIYTRCARTAFCDEFGAMRRQLIVESKSEEDTLMALELMNIGRLRIASKGITRNTAPEGEAAPRYVSIDPEGQRREGLYMLGDVARLRRSTCTLAALHAAVSVDSVSLLRARAAAIPAAPPPRPREPIAIVGMACNFPRAHGLRAYWQNILHGVDAITEVSDERFASARLFDTRRAPDRIYAKWGGFLDDIAFDPQHYGIAPATLSVIEPAQLLALEVARQALEDAGFAQRPFARERTACIMAVGGVNELSTIYNFRTLLPLYLDKVDGLPEETRRHIVDTLFEQVLPKWTEDTFPGILGNVVAGRVANRFDLGGSNFAVDAACASSLAALEIGFRQLRDGDADVALVGGVDCTNSPVGYMSFAQTHALSPRGRSRPFDAGADGIAISEGVGAVVLKRLGDAERDGDRIYAVIDGVGSASDGRNRSLTAPHPPGQVAAIRRAYREAGFDPASVTLIEAHGTGTALGDKSEITALGMVLGQTPTPACAIGSVKSMIGHTKVVAGLAGLIKAALALQNRVLPPTIGVERPIAELQAAGSPLYVNSETRPWLHLGRAHPRRCGVSAFGFGGTNFHAVLSEYTGTYRPADLVSLQPRDVELFAFAGATRDEIQGTVRRLLEGLAGAPEVDLAQLAFALYSEQHVVRHANGGQPCRLVLVAGSCADLRQKLQRALALLAEQGQFRQAPGLHYRESVGAVGSICFLFPGQGAQRVNMLRELVSSLPALHACFEQPSAGDASQPRIADLIYPLPAFDDATRDAQRQALNATEIAQPALGMTSLAAFDVLTSYGLRPDFVAGHSYGEYVALCAAGAISRDDLIRISMVRGRLSAMAPGGAMAALDVGGEAAAAAIARHGLAVSPANLNAPDQTIIAGSEDAIEAAQTALAQDGMRVKRLAVSTAFHCSHMAPARSALADALADIPFAAPRIPVFSNLTAEPYPEHENEIRRLLARHIAEPVRFVDEIEALYASGVRVFIECGPGLILTGLVGRILGVRAHTVLALDAPERDGWEQLAQLLSQAMAAGLLVDMAPWFAGRGLAAQGIDDVFAHERRRTEHGPLIWRVNGGRAVPWAGPTAAAVAATPVPGTAAPVVQGTAAPAAPAATTATAALPARPIQVFANPPPVPAVAPRDVSHHFRRSTMSTNEFVPDDLARHATAPLATRPAGANELLQIQDGLARLLAFQSDQQHSLRHFLDFQAQLAGLAPPPQAMWSASTMAPSHDRLQIDNAPLPMQMSPATPAASPMLSPVPAVAPSVMATVASAAPAAAPRKPIEAPMVPMLFSHEPAAAPQPVPAILSGASAPDTATSAGPATVAEFSAELLKAVSARTGYPVDMLDLDAHMEADLGIDSIKRIEIFSGLTQRNSLVGDRDDEKMIEELSGFKTLREVEAWYAQLFAQATTAALSTDVALAGGALPKKALAPLSRLDEEVESFDLSPQPDPVRSYVVQARSADATADGAAAWPPGCRIVLVGAVSALANALHERLAAQGCTVRQLVPGAATRAVDAWRLDVDLSSLESVLPIAQLVAAEGEPVAALINLMGHDEAVAGTDHRNDARALFLLLKVLGPGLRRDTAGGAGRLVNVTAFDGRFGLDGPSGQGPGSAGTLGVAKSAAREWSQIRVKCIDAAPALAPDWLAEQVLKEMFSDDPEVEIGFSAQGRCRICLAPRTIERGALSALMLGDDAVVLVTGGAYGITADLTRMLAEKYRPRLVLVGRSPEPGDESGVTRGIVDSAELRRRLTAELRAGGGKVTPVQVEAAMGKVLKERQIRVNLAALRGAASALEYHCLDVRDGAALGALVDDVYARLGRIDGVLHGAGVISDKLIANKPLAAFDAVYDTKVVPALVMASRLRMQGLRFIAFFSSVAGRFGNIGQADYSAANEVLNKLAGQLSHAWPHLHALAINWGPWDAGMVNDDLRRLYAARDIRPIAPATGRRLFLEELEHGPQRQAEIVITSSISQIAALRLVS